MHCVVFFRRRFLGRLCHRRFTALTGIPCASAEALPLATRGTLGDTMGIAGLVLTLQQPGVERRCAVPGAFREYRLTLCEIRAGAKLGIARLGTALVGRQGALHARHEARDLAVEGMVNGPATVACAAHHVQGAARVPRVAVFLYGFFADEIAALPAAVLSGFAGLLGERLGAGLGDAPRKGDKN